MPISQKSREHKIIKYKIAKEEHVNPVDPGTHLSDADCMGSDPGNVAGWITLEQYAETQDITQSMR